MERPIKATLRETREHNQRLVLATLYDDGPVSRAEVARRTGLTRTTVSAVVESLLADGLAREVGRGPSTGGKAPILVQVPDDARLLVGVDLGDSVFRGATVNLRGESLHRIEVPSDDADGDAALDRAFDLLDRLLAVQDGRVLGIGIGAPGIIDTRVGTVLQAVKRDWRRLPLGEIVHARYHLPVYVANDSQVAALAEHVFGPVRATNLVAIKVGLGIGAGLVLNGELFQGDGFGAGEIGHTVVEPNGELCRCGSRGCLETVASTRAVLARLEALRGVPVSLPQAVEAFRQGDPDVCRVVLEAGSRLGTVVAGLVGVLDVQRIVLAGTMAAFGAPWLAAVQVAMQRGALPALVQATRLELGGVDDIVVLGASALLMTRELGLNLRPTRPVRGPLPAAVA
ncbi:MAG: ROK family protein [Candidatus Limnocylindrales bacterium]